MTAKIFIMSLIGMIYIIASPIWAYWTGTGGILMMLLGVTFILIAKDIQYEEEYEKIQAESLQSLKRKKMRAEQHRPITEPIGDNDLYDDDPMQGHRSPTVPSPRPSEEST